MANGKKKIQRSAAFFSCVPGGRAKRATFACCNMGNNHKGTSNNDGFFVGLIAGVAHR
jgi:hypothetical protein